MLQSIDDLELSSLLPKLLKDAVDTLSLGWDWDPARHVRLIDLGCGTGRNTAKLLNHASLFYAGPDRHTSVQVVGLDFSAGMLEVAEEKLEALDWGVSLDLGERFELDLRLERADCFPTVKDKAASPMPDVVRLLPGNVVISTLVLEHVPLKDYFATLAALTWDDCYALVTNMHSEMGRMSQAGFVNAQGVKVRGTSFVYTPEETAQAAKEAGFEVLDLRERKMDADIVEKGLVGERGRKWIGINVWYGLVLKRVGGQNEQAYWEAIRAKNSEK